MISFILRRWRARPVPFRVISAVGLGALATLLHPSTIAKAELSVDPAIDLTLRSRRDVLFADGAARPAGGLVLSGRFTFVDGARVDASLIALDDDGRLDETFHAAPTDGLFQHVEVLPDGKILVAGFFTEVGGVARPGLARLMPDGSLDASFSPVAPDLNYVSRFAASPDGSFYCIGLDFSGPLQTVIRKFDASGQFDRAFPRVVVEGYPLSLAAGPAGELAVTTNRNGTEYRVFRFDTNGVEQALALPAMFNGSGICFEPDGSLVVSGQTYPGSGPSLVRIRADGSLDTGFSGIVPVQYWGGPSVVRTAGGGFAVLRTGGNDYRTREIRHFSADGHLVGGVTAEFLGGPIGNLALISGTSEGYYMFGAFDLVDGVAAPTVARISESGSVDDFVADIALPGTVAGLVPFSGDNILAVGTFTEIDDQAASGLVAFTPSDAFSTDVPYALGSIKSAFATADGGAVILGGFQAFPGTATGGLAKIDAQGVVDSAFMGGFPIAGAEAGVSMPDGTVVLGGNFSASSGPTGNFMMRLLASGGVDPSFRSPVLTSTSYPRIWAMGRNDDGRIAFAGTFEMVDGLPRPGVAVLDGNGLVDPSFAPAVGLSSSGSFPTAVTLLDDGRIYAIGDRADDPSIARSLVRFTEDGALDPNWLPDFDATRATAYLVEPDGSLLVAVSAAPGETDGRVLRVAESGALLPEPAIEVGDGYVATLYRDSQDRLWLGGSFASINGVAREGVARFADATLSARILGPGELKVPIGKTVVLHAEAAHATGTVRYRWNIDGHPIPLARCASLVVPGLRILDGASISVTVSDDNASVTSEPVIVKIVKRKR